MMTQMTAGCIEVLVWSVYGFGVMWEWRSSRDEHRLHPWGIMTHLLGLAPAGYLTAPDNGPWAGCGLVQVKATVVALCN
jgi:hypothetical protein